MNFLVLGSGAWGTAMAVHLDSVGHEVTLAVKREEALEEMRKTGQNAEHLLDVSLGSVELSLARNEAGQYDAIFVALPSYAIAEGFSALKAQAPVYISLAKGVDMQTHETSCELIARLRPSASVLTLTGPSHAASVARRLPCALVLAGAASNVDELQAAISAPTLRVYTSSDRRGCELGAAIKNAFAVAAGVCDGLGMGDNAKAALLTRGLTEMSRLGVALGGNKETFFGLTGAGDLMATSYGLWSRNRQLGEGVAQGKTPQELIEGGLTAEGYRSSKALLDLAKAKKVESPILEQVVAVLHNGKAPAEALRSLMNRPLKGE